MPNAEITSKILANTRHEAVELLNNPGNFVVDTYKASGGWYERLAIGVPEDALLTSQDVEAYLRKTIPGHKGMTCVSVVNHLGFPFMFEI